MSYGTSLGEGKSGELNWVSGDDGEYWVGSGHLWCWV